MSSLIGGRLLHKGNVMDVRGWVYVISNAAMPGLVKVGFSTKDPKIRAGKLGGTGVPYPHVVEYDALVNAPRDAERKIHQALQAHRVKVSAETPVGKEWFRCSPEMAVETIRKLTEGKRLLESSPTPPGSASTSSCVSEQLNEPFYGTALRARRTLASRGGSWTLGKRSLVLTHKRTGRRFRSSEYSYDGGTTIKGFSIKSRDTPWVPLEDVEFTE
jgi:T5orf172 domain